MGDTCPGGHLSGGVSCPGGADVLGGPLFRGTVVLGRQMYLGDPCPEGQLTSIARYDQMSFCYHTDEILNKETWFDNTVRGVLLFPGYPSHVIGHQSR